MQKICKDCGAVKPLEAFYRHPMMRDGHLNTCRICRCLYQRGRAAAGYTAEIDRRRYRNNPARREAMRLKTIRWRERNPEGARAQAMVQRAIRAGRLLRQPCQECGRRAQAHHDDYAMPLAVVWLCPKHHTLWHRILIVTAELDRALQLVSANSDIPMVVEA